MSLRIPENISVIQENHAKWLQILQDIKYTSKEDFTLQKKADKGLCLKSRKLPVEVLGRSYVQYISLLNRLYDAYLLNVQLQREPYMTTLISIVSKRTMELEKELQDLVVNDFIYVDASLVQLHRTPCDIQIVVPYHYAVVSRTDRVEGLLQKMWEASVRRKRRADRADGPQKAPKMPRPPSPRQSETHDVDLSAPERDERRSWTTVVEEEEIGDDVDSFLSVPSEHTLVPESYTNILLIQRHERFRAYYLAACMNRQKLAHVYREVKAAESPLEMRERAAEIIQKVYRAHMRCKRQRMDEKRRDIILGIIPDPFRQHCDLSTEQTKIYKNRHQIRQKLTESYKKDLDKVQTRLVRITKDNQIEDITSEIREWFKEWYYGYGFFSPYPLKEEGGTVLVLKLEWPSPEERRQMDQEEAQKGKGKGKEELKNEAKRLQEEKAQRLKAEAEARKKMAEALFKARCNPLTDPGYTVRQSGVNFNEILTEYDITWSALDPFVEADRRVIYGYIESLMAEELMVQIHKDCREYVDELMRLDLKLLIRRQQQLYKRMGWQFPKVKPRIRGRPPPPYTPLVTADPGTLKEFEKFFDMNIISKPNTKFKDIIGDFNYHAYDCNIKDPDASFPGPCMSDLRNRLVVSCIFGCGLNDGAEKLRSVMLLGPPHGGKSYLVDAVCGEMNAVKIDISPEAFSRALPKANRFLPKVLLAARALQPTVIYCRNVERIFYKKVPSAESSLKPTAIKKGLEKLVKGIKEEDKIIFIGTCSNPWACKAKPLVKIFNKIILMPRTDYGSLRQFFYTKLMRIRSIFNYPLEIVVQPLAQFFRGYGLGTVIRVYDQVMTAERIVRLNVTPLNFMEFVEPLVADEGNILDPTTDEEYRDYQDFWLKNSPLRKPREEFQAINASRAVVYEKLAKKEAKKSEN